MGHNNNNNNNSDNTPLPLTATAPSVQRDLGGPVVEGARHEDLLGRAGPPEDGGPSLSAGTLAVALQVLLPGQELLDLLWSLEK